jgi:hypothetical protein
MHVDIMMSHDCIDYCNLLITVFTICTLTVRVVAGSPALGRVSKKSTASEVFGFETEFSVSGRVSGLTSERSA